MQTYSKFRPAGFATFRSLAIGKGNPVAYSIRICNPIIASQMLILSPIGFGNPKGKE